MRNENKDDLLRVNVLVFPDGTTLWMLAADLDEVNAAGQRWIDANPKLAANCKPGHVSILMPREHYNSVPATVESANLTGAPQHPS